MMDEEQLDFGEDEINRLAEELSAVKLGHQERALLLAIFAVAADRTQVPELGHAQLPKPITPDQAPEAGSDKKKATLDKLRHQLLNSYIPGDPDLPVPGGFTAKVTGMPPPPPPPPK